MNHPILYAFVSIIFLFELWCAFNSENLRQFILSGKKSKEEPVTDPATILSNGFKALSFLALTVIYLWILIYGMIELPIIRIPCIIIFIMGVIRYIWSKYTINNQIVWAVLDILDSTISAILLAYIFYLGVFN